MEVLIKAHFDEHHRGLIYWALHGKEGIASDEEVTGWVHSQLDIALQNASDLKGES